MCPLMHMKLSTRPLIIHLFFIVSIIVQSCTPNKEIMDKSIYEDLSAEEVLSISNTIPSFRFFYDKIRARIIYNSDEYDKITYKDVTYNRMYALFNYWGSSEMESYINDNRLSWKKKMIHYQAQIDSVSNHFKRIIDTFKVCDAPEYNYSSIFKHPEVCSFNFGYNSPSYYSGIAFTLPIKNQEMFNEIGFEKLEFKVTLTTKDGEELRRGSTYHWAGQYTMYAFGDGKWSLSNPSKTYMPGYFDSVFELKYASDFNNSYKGSSPYKSFEESFDWYYEVLYVIPDYLTFLKNKVPHLIYDYWEAQEDMSISKYISVRDKMIVEYADNDYVPWNQTLPIIVENRMKELFLKEYELYQKAHKKNESNIVEFETMMGKAAFDTEDVMSSDVHLPVINPNGNYVKSYDFDRKNRRNNTTNYL